MAAEELSITEQFYNQVSESIKSVFDLTSRIDERVKILMEKQNELDEKFEKVLDQHNNLIARVSLLESKDYAGMKRQVDDMERRVAILETKGGSDGLKKDVEQLEQKVQTLEIKQEGLNIFKSGAESKFKTATDMVFKVIVAVVAAYLLWKLGIKL